MDYVMGTTDRKLEISDDGVEKVWYCNQCSIGCRVVGDKPVVCQRPGPVPCWSDVDEA